MGFIYIASPYSHELESVKQDRYERVADLCALLTRQGKVVYSPIVHWHPVAKKHRLHTGYEYWRKSDELFVTLADRVCVFMLDGWKESEGVTYEIALARTLGKNVTFVAP